MVGALCIILSSCQETPEESSVVSKVDGISEAAVCEPLKKGEKRETNVPTHWKFEEKKSNDRVVIQADIKLGEQSIGNLPVIEMQNHELTQEELNGLIDYFTDGEELYMKMDMKNLETQIRQKQPELDGKIAKLQAKIERNLEYRKRAYEQFMDEVLSKEEYLELKQMYETENQKYQKELSELNHEEQRQRAAVNETKIWLEHFNRRRITVKQLTREALVELVDKIYVYPEQKIDIYFKFASVESSPDRILEKDGVI